MIQPPKSSKYRKYQRNYRKVRQSSGSVRKTKVFSQKYPGGPHNASKLARKHSFVAFGSYGLQCNQPTSISLQQLETCRRLLRRVIKRQAPV
jgi:ribosomal protein L16/L10AE